MTVPVWLVVTLAVVFGLVLLTGLVLVARFVGWRKCLKALAALCAVYPALLILIKLFGIFEGWVWLLIVIAVGLWILSSLGGREQRYHTRLEETSVPATQPEPEFIFAPSAPPPPPASSISPAPAS